MPLGNETQGPPVNFLGPTNLPKPDHGDIPAGQIRLWDTAHPHQTISAWLGDTPPTPSPLGGAAWEEVPLHKRLSVLIWRGHTLISLSVPIVLDGLIVNKSVGNDIARLLEWWRPSTGPSVQPPILKLAARGLYVPYQSARWILNQVDWGDGIRDDGIPVQQTFTLTLIEYNEDERLQTAAAAKGKPKGKRRVYVWKRGDNFSAVARHLHVSVRDLAAAQHPVIHDARTIKVGRRLIVP